MPPTGLRARARCCRIFKHTPPHQSGCGLAQLFKDLSTPLGTVFGDTSDPGEKLQQVNFKREQVFLPRMGFVMQMTVLALAAI
jgi:hypothetical protein